MDFSCKRTYTRYSKPNVMLHSDKTGQKIHDTIISFCVHHCGTMGHRRLHRLITKPTISGTHSHLRTAALIANQMPYVTVHLEKNDYINLICTISSNKLAGSLFPFFWETPYPAILSPTYLIGILILHLTNHVNKILWYY